MARGRVGLSSQFGERFGFKPFPSLPPFRHLPQAGAWPEPLLLASFLPLPRHRSRWPTGPTAANEEGEREAGRKRQEESQAMDPSTDELLAMAGVGDAQAWIGMSDALLAGVREVIGDFQLFREVALIPDVVWDAATGTIRVITVPPVLEIAAELGPDGAVLVAGVAAVARVDRPPMPLEVGQVGSLRRVSRLRIGEPATAAAPAPQAHAFPPGPPLAGGAPMVGGPRTLKMKRLQVDDTRSWRGRRRGTCCA